MKIISRTCDRCAAEGGPHEDYGEWGQIKGRWMPASFKSPWWDLCPHCAIAFYEWFNAVRPKKEATGDDIPF